MPRTQSPRGWSPIASHLLTKTSPIYVYKDKKKKYPQYERFRSVKDGGNCGDGSSGPVFPSQYTTTVRRKRTSSFRRLTGAPRATAPGDRPSERQTDGRRVPRKTRGRCHKTEALISESERASYLQTQMPANGTSPIDGHVRSGAFLAIGILRHLDPPE